MESKTHWIIPVKLSRHRQKTVLEKCVHLLRVEDKSKCHLLLKSIGLSLMKALKLKKISSLYWYGMMMKNIYHKSQKMSFVIEIGQWLTLVITAMGKATTICLQLKSWISTNSWLCWAQIYKIKEFQIRNSATLKVTLVH